MQRRTSLSPILLAVLAGCPASPSTPSVPAPPGLQVSILEDVADPDDGETSLREAVAVAVAAGAGTVEFAPALRGTLTLGAPLVIDGGADVAIQGPEVNALLVSGDRSVGLFVVRGGSLAIHDLDLHQGHAEHGGAIAVHEGSLELRQLRLVDNVATDAGGAVWMGPDAGTLDAQDVEFVGNRAGRFGAGIASFGREGVRLNRFDMLQNQGLDGSGIWGAALYADGGLLDLSQGSVRESHSERGAVALDGQTGTLKVDNVTFLFNQAEDVGGALFVQSSLETVDSMRIDLVDAEFENNEANRGGAVYLAGPGATLTSVNGIFGRNRALDPGAAGGAIWTAGSIDLTGGVFIDNAADPAAQGGVPSEGGAVAMVGVTDGTSLRAVDVTFTANDADLGGAVSLGSLDEASFDGCTFQFNTAQVAGGGLHARSVLQGLSITGSTFVSNDSGERGGGLQLETDTTLASTSVTLNTAVFGGGVYLATGATLHLESGTEVTENTATSTVDAHPGGGVCDQGVLDAPAGAVSGNSPTDTCSVPES